MHPNSLASLLRTLTLPSPVKGDFDPDKLTDVNSELTVTQAARAKDRAHRAIFVPSLVSKLLSSFARFLDSKASGDLSAAELPSGVLADIHESAKEFSAQPEDGYAENDFINNLSAFGALVKKFAIRLDTYLPADLRAGNVTCKPFQVCDTSMSDPDGKQVLVETQADFVFRRNGTFCIVLEAKNPTASLEARLFRRLLAMFGIQTVRQLNAALKRRDSHVYSLLVKVRSAFPLSSRSS
jgi:hypothetical protein